MREEKKVAMILVDSKQTKAILLPMLPSDVDQIAEPHADGFRCFLPPAQKVSINYQEASENHYNQLVRSKEDRHRSKIFHMRNLNNFCKLLLIEQSVKHLSPPPEKGMLRVLDFACGKGGDMIKWLPIAGGIHEYCGVDSARYSLEDFVARIVSRGQKEQKQISRLVCCDMGRESLLDGKNLTYYTHSDRTWKSGTPFNLEDEAGFDVASCQFALHYMFESYDRASFFFSQLSRLLSPGGVFIATTVDCRVMAEMAADAISGAWSSSSPSMQSTATREINVHNELHQPLLRVSFEESDWDRLLQDPLAMLAERDGRTDEIQEDEDRTHRSAFGIRYTFNLLDGDDESKSAVNAPEWLVPLGKPLEAILAANSMTLVSCTNFHDLVMTALENQPSQNQQMEKMSVRTFCFIS
jgi:mRNA (guanine-N7-)-methyltransferase